MTKTEKSKGGRGDSRLCSITYTWIEQQTGLKREQIRYACNKRKDFDHRDIISTITWVNSVRRAKGLPPIGDAQIAHSETSFDADQTYGESIMIDLKPGMAWAVYSDDGPGGPCGQSMRTTCAHTVLYTWPTEEAMKLALSDQKWRNKNHRLMFGVVGEYTSGGVFRVIQCE